MAEFVVDISLVRKVRLEDVCRVGFDAVEEHEWQNSWSIIFFGNLT